MASPLLLLPGINPIFGSLAPPLMRPGHLAHVILVRSDPRGVAHRPRPRDWNSALRGSLPLDAVAGLNRMRRSSWRIERETTPTRESYAVPWLGTRVPYAGKYLGRLTEIEVFMSSVFQEGRLGGKIMEMSTRMTKHLRRDLPANRRATSTPSTGRDICKPQDRKKHTRAHTKDYLHAPSRSTEMKYASLG